MLLCNKITLLYRYIYISIYIYNILYEHGRKAILTKNKCWMHLGTKFIL